MKTSGTQAITMQRKLHCLTLEYGTAFLSTRRKTHSNTFSDEAKKKTDMNKDDDYCKG